MIVVERGTEEDFEPVWAIDMARGVTGSDSAAYLDAAIRKRQLLIARDGETRLGYAIVNDEFFGQPFIWLVVTHPDQRRRGVATALIGYIERTRPTDKLFTSTNESNAPMRELLEKLGYVRSGTIDNLDEGDPEWIYFKRLERR